MFKNFIKIFCLIILVSGCLKSMNKSIELNLSIDQDKEYFKIYTKYTKKFELISNFETHAIIAITFLSSEFYQAFAKRYKHLYAAQEDLFQGMSYDKVGFFVSVHSDNTNLRKLDDINLWNIFLEHNNEIINAQLIKPLLDKERWIPFFKDVNKWSREYLLVFDLKFSDNNNQQFILSEKFKLVLACSYGKIFVQY